LIKGEHILVGNYLALITTLVTLLFIMIQRTVPKRRRLTFVFVGLCLLIIRHNAFLKGDLHEETVIAFALALLLSGVFWLLIGRYNPVKTDDEIQVMGMDD
jgi:hypothetical protein